MSLISPKEGVNQLKVLSHAAGCQSEGFKQVDIVERSSLTKGAVSNNCKKLVNEDLLLTENSTYYLNDEKLIDYYRTHIEDYFRRRDIPDRFRYYNEIRTRTKMKINQLFDGEIGDLIHDILISILSKANRDGQIKTIQDLFNRVDYVLCKASEDVYLSDEESDFGEDLLLLAVSMDRSPEYLSILEDYQIELTNTITFKMSEDIKRGE